MKKMFLFFASVMLLNKVLHPFRGNKKIKKEKLA